MADFNNYTNYADNAGVSSVIFGANSTVLEVELNEMQEIQKHYMREFFKSVVGNGITDISKLTYSDGKIKIADGCNIVCNGYLIKANKLELAIASGSTAYLWIWEDEVDYNDTLHVEGNYNNTDNVKNWIKDDRADNETTRRKVVRYQLSDTAPSNLVKYSYIAIAKIVGKQMIKLVSEVNPNKSDYTDDDIYGVEVDWENNTSVRLAGSIGKTGGADHNDIMAFNRRKCIIDSAGTVIAYYGEDGYNESGGTDDNSRTYVMVEQNKFYYKVVPVKLEKIDDGTGYKVRKARYYISDTPKDGFKVHPAFVRSDGETTVEIDKIYIASYKASLHSATSGIVTDDSVAVNVSSDSLTSVAGVRPASGWSNNLTRDNMRTLASHISDYWQLKDFAIMSMDILLFLIEYGTLNAQNIVGLGFTHDIAGEVSNFANITGSTTHFGNDTSIAIDNDNGLTSITYRGEEDIFGSLWEYIEGLNINNGYYYWADYGFAEGIKTSPYKPCGIAVTEPLTATSGYITAFGYSMDCDFAFIPVEISDDDTNVDGSIGDRASIGPLNNTWRSAVYGGSWDGKLDCGICAFDSAMLPANGSHNNVGGRLAYVPSSL